MPNIVAFPLAGLIFAAIALDQIFNGGQGTFYMALKAHDLIETAVFWR